MVRGIFANVAQALVAIIAICAAGCAVAAPKQTVIHNFIPEPAGVLPDSALVADSSGALYGTTENGGVQGQGTVFKLTPPAAGHTDWTESVIYGFQGGSDGYSPMSALTPDKSGGFFGTTVGGGTHNFGTIFRLTPPGEGQTGWIKTVLHSFNVANVRSWSEPVGPLVLDSSGNLYGAVKFFDPGGGVVYKLARPKSADGAWSFETLHIFSGGPDGGPQGPLAIDEGGAIYGLTSDGGRFYKGTLFQLLPPVKGGKAWTKTILHNFGSGGGDVTGPTGGLIKGPNGTLYGTGASANGGCVFKMTPPASGQSTWIETTISLGIHAYGPLLTPNGPLVIDSDGALYGTVQTQYETVDGAANILFKLAPPAHAGGDWVTTKLHSFNSYGLSVGLFRDSKGVLYGTAQPYYNFAQDQGIVFDVVPPSAGETSWTEHTLYSFRVTDGQGPMAALVADSAGNLYGTTSIGGPYDAGTVFKLVPPTPQHPAWTEAILHSFNRDDGEYPVSPLLIDAKGAIYGTTNRGGSSNRDGGVVFKLTPPAKKGADWSDAVLYSFYDTFRSPEQVQLATSLVSDKTGAIYGVLGVGGKYNAGQIFKLKPPNSQKSSWTESSIYDINSSVVGENINLGLIIDSNGALYMTTMGNDGSGATAFKLIPPTHGATVWTPVVIYRFAAGQAPDSPPIANSNGALFGVSGGGGAFGKGFAYKLTPPTLTNTPWTETILHSFGKGSDAVNPFAAVTLDKNGAVYGTAISSSVLGSNDVVFKLTPPSSTMAGWTESLLGQFTSEFNQYPNWGIYATPTGTIYGTTDGGGLANAGTVFQITQ